jgi:hypothetical protein
MSTSKGPAGKADEPEYEASRPGIKFLLCLVAAAIVIAVIALRG